MQQSKPQPAKNVYHAPRLTVYGKVSNLTQGTTAGTRKDGSGNIFQNKS
jgi:hypothetical protein